MDTNPILDFKIQDAIVRRLVVQYSEYVLLAEARNVAEQQYALSKISHSLSNGNHKIIRRIEDRLSDEMTFYTPRIWMLYKYTAYKNSPKEISTFGDLIEHCSPKGYICTKRFHFIKEWLFKDKKVNLLGIFSEQESIRTAIDNPIISSLESNADFMNKWLDNEFCIIDSSIAKWNT
jgi:hypothetical protein